MTILRIDAIIERKSCLFAFSYDRGSVCEEVPYDKDLMKNTINSVCAKFEKAYGDIDVEYVIYHFLYSDIFDFVDAICDQHNYLLAISSEKCDYFDEPNIN